MNSFQFLLSMTNPALLDNKQRKLKLLKDGDKIDNYA